eukprot:COSAG02_NODE_2668_length_8293_cov_23.094825_12_plen_145_part_00
MTERHTQLPTVRAVVWMLVDVILRALHVSLEVRQKGCRRWPGEIVKQEVVVTRDACDGDPMRPRLVAWVDVLQSARRTRPPPLGIEPCPRQESADSPSTARTPPTTALCRAHPSPSNYPVILSYNRPRMYVYMHVLMYSPLWRF